MDSPIATYGDYNVGVGLGTGDTVAEGMEQAAEQADPADASASGAPAASVPVTEDTVDTDQADEQDADGGIKPLQSMVEDVDSGCRRHDLRGHKSLSGRRSSRFRRCRRCTECC